MFTRASAGKMRRSAVILLLIVIPSAPVLAQKAFPPITADDRIIVVVIRARPVSPFGPTFGFGPRFFGGSIVTES